MGFPHNTTQHNTTQHNTQLASDAETGRIAYCPVHDAAMAYPSNGDSVGWGSQCFVSLEDVMHRYAPLHLQVINLQVSEEEPEAGRWGTYPWVDRQLLSAGRGQASGRAGGDSSEPLALLPPLTAEQVSVEESLRVVANKDAVLGGLSGVFAEAFARAKLVSTKALPLPCVATAILSKTVPFLVVCLAQNLTIRQGQPVPLTAAVLARALLLLEDSSAGDEAAAPGTGAAAAAVAAELGEYADDSPVCTFIVDGEVEYAGSGRDHRIGSTTDKTSAQTFVNRRAVRQEATGVAALHEVLAISPKATLW
eukprot:SAG22_NODE_897_length_6629_cov_4.853446_5_plen_308_part_00